MTGLGLVALYFFGIAIFASYSSAFGVPPFEFSLQHCLEYGGAYAGVILTLLPLLAVCGMVDYLRKAGADPVKFGIRHWDGFTLNMVIRAEQWKVAKIDETFLMGLLAAVYGFLTIRYSDRSIAAMRAAGEHVWAVTVAGRRIFYVLFAAMPKVDASIRGLSALTSRSFLIQVAEYERSYAFYVPTEQTIIKVPREQLEYVLFKQDVSPFADRSLFRKGSWLGVRGQWRAAAGSRVTESGGAVGFEVATVDVGSSGSKAGIKPADLLVSRDGKPLKLKIQLELAR